MSIRWKFTIFIFLIFSVSTLSTFYFFWSVGKTVKNDALHDLDLVSDFIVADLLHKQKDKTLQAVNFSLDGKLVDLFERYIASKSLLERDTLHDYLSTKKDAYSSLMIDASITDLSGRVVASSNLAEIGKNIYFNEFKQSPDYPNAVFKEETVYAPISDIESTKIVENTIEFSIPILNDKQQKIGFFVGKFFGVDFDSFLNGTFYKDSPSIKASISRYSSSDIYLVNKDNIGITSNKLTGDAVLQTINTDSVRSCLESSTDYSGVYIDSMSDVVYGVSKCVNLRDWILVSEVKETDITEHINSLYVKTVVIALLLYVAILAIIFSFLDSIVIRIKKEVASLSQINSGDLSVRIIDSDQDEIGLVALGINQLASTLEQDKKKIESEQQKQQETIKELEKLNRLMVDRELRMVELKTELKKYKK